MYINTLISILLSVFVYIHVIVDIQFIISIYIYIIYTFEFISIYIDVYRILIFTYHIHLRLYSKYILTIT